MEFDSVFLNLIYISGCLICVTVYIGALDVEQQQVYLKSELPKNLVIINRRPFQVLKQPQKCSYRDLEKCHNNEHMHEMYYERCYSDDCPSEKYFCLNVPDGNAIHLCGEPNPWNKRLKDIAVLDQGISGHVDVYRTDCPVGYFQENKRNAFTPCVKDESLVFVEKNTNNSLALWRCNTLKNYCNSHGASFFELGSDEDSCVHTNYDLKTKCSPTDELAPNCSCTERCPAGEERVWDGTNTCRIINKSATISRGTNSVYEQVTKATKNTTISSHRANHTTTQLGIRNSSRQVEDNSVGNFYRKGPKVNIALIIGCSVGGVLTVIIICFIVWFLRRRKNKKEAGRNNEEKNSDDRKMYKGCDFSKISTVNGNVYVTLEDKSERRTRDNGFSMPGIKSESDDESGDTISLESGYDTVQRGQQMPGQDTQTMMEMKNMNTGSRRTENFEETDVLKPLSET